MFEKIGNDAVVQYHGAEYRIEKRRITTELLYKAVRWMYSIKQNKGEYAGRFICDICAMFRTRAKAEEDAKAIIDFLAEHDAL